MKVKAVFQNPTFVGYKELKNAISKSKVNGATTNAFIDLQENKLVVTNGAILLAYPLAIISADTDISGVVVNPFLFDINKWTVIEELKEQVKMGFYDFEIRDDGYVYVMCSGYELYRAQYYPEFVYPEWKNLFNQHVTSSVMETTLLAQNLGDLSKSIPKTVGGIINFSFGGSGKGIKFNIEIDEVNSVDGLLMPLFGGHE